MNAKVIGVRFPRNDAEYLFISHVDVNVGDVVVVDTRNGLAVVTVSNTDVSDTVKATKEVVAVVDMTAYNERRAREKRVAELREKIDAKVHEYQEIAMYELFAMRDPEVKSMLDELKGLL